MGLVRLDKRLGKIKVLESLPGCDHCPVLFEHLYGREKWPTKLRLSLPSILHCTKESIATYFNELSRIDRDFELAFVNSSDAYDKFAGRYCP